MESLPEFLMNPLLVNGLSVSLHFILLVLVVFNGRPRFQRTKTFPRIKLVIVCSALFSAFNLIFILSTYSYETKWNTTLDVVLKSVSWAALAVLLHFAERVPGFLTSWCFLNFIASCYATAADVVRVSATASLVSDAVSMATSAFLCGVLSLMRVSDNTNLEEPLLPKEEPKGCDEVTPFADAGCLNVLTFYWMGSLIKMGNQKTLSIVDVPQLYKKDSVIGLLSDFRRSLGSATDVTTLKLAAAVFNSVWEQLVFTGLLALVYTTASYVGPALIDSFVIYINGKGEDRNRGYLLASAFFTAKMVECVSQRHWLFRMQRIGMRMRAVLVTEIYGKSLKLSSAVKKKQATGEIVNLMAVDAERIDDFSWYLHDCWLVFIQVGFALAVLHRNLGMATAATLLATVMVMLLNFPLGRLQEKFQRRLMEEKDGRMKSTSEILRNMRILKLQGWEMKFLEKILEHREREEGWLRKYVYNSALVSFVFWAAPSLVAVATFCSCIALGVPLASGKILSALATFRVLQEPIYNLPDCISMLIQTKVSLDRIAAFLRHPDIDVNNVEKLPRGTSQTVVEIANGDFSWESSFSRLTLNGLNLEVRRGMHVAVCGTVGSGKSSLLSCILGELPKMGGTLKVCGKKAYVAQSPWIQSGKIEENILFGEEMDRERYDQVIDACCLRKDLEILPFGDQTVIGERGINLSGGQKQRVQIARALYQDADIYLFDDPFSAVDAHTGSHLFKEVLRGILSSKTIIYVTHQVEFLPMADQILVMKDGRISQKGKYDEILNSGSDFMELVSAHHVALSVLDHRQIDETETKDQGDIKEEESTKGSNDKEVKKQLVEEEEREKGQVGFKIYYKYLTTAYGGALVPLIILCQVIFQVLQIASNYWMAWATPVSEEVKPIVKTSTLLIVYSSLTLSSALCILCRASLTATAGYKTATILFQKMHYCIFRAPMAFFDATPSGRILNRASTDQSTIDLQMAYHMGSTAFATILLLGVIAVMSQVAWQVFGVFIPVVAACIWYQQYYISSARELSRLVGVCKAPVIQHFAETISGSTTIRSFDQQTRFAKMNMKLTDEYSRPKFHIAAAMEWLCFRLDMLTSATFAFSLIFLVLFPDRIKPAVAGLAITYGLNLNTTQAWMIWNICNLENKVISVERVLQYMSIASEPPLVIEDHRPDPSWPSNGEIRVNSLQVRYADHLPLVIRGLSCTFKGGEKIGIVGRTGSGKSTLIQALFRIVEPASGSIEIDGMDIRSVGVHDLRTRLSIIPQDPTMFEGTVRGNLDPLGEYADTEIWEALEKCQLGDEVRRSPDKLDASVSENGENWSMGQRQLVCLGRVLLKKRKVLVLDEATASVDTFTDNLIQLTLKRHFWDCTVITIAHRITSVLDSHKVLVLGNGVLEEFDSPANLLANKSSSFSKLVAEYTARSTTILRSAGTE